MSGPYLGDVLPWQKIHHMWDSYAADGASLTPGTAGTISVYKDNGTTQTTTGVTDTRGFDSLTGIHLVIVDPTTDATFYSLGGMFHVVLSGSTVDGKSVNAVLCSFSIMRDMLQKGIARAGTAQAASSTSVTMDSPAAFSNNTPNAMTCLLFNETLGYVQSRRVSASSGDVLTVDTFVQDPSSGTNRFILTATPPVTLDGPNLRTNLGLASANLDTQLGNQYSGIQATNTTLAAAAGYNGSFKSDWAAYKGVPFTGTGAVGDNIRPTGISPG